MNFKTSSPLWLRLPRMLDWLIYALVLMLAVCLLAPQQLPVSLYKLSLIALAAVAGYWIDRSLFPYARPDSFLECDDDPDPEVGEEDLPLGVSMLQVREAADPPWLRLMGVSMLRRAIIVAAAMIAVGLGA